MFLTTQPIDLAAMFAKPRLDGAIAVFLGVVRNENDGPADARSSTRPMDRWRRRRWKRSRPAREQWPSVRVAGWSIATGRLQVGEVSVAVAAASPHRAEAFAACRAAIDRIKTTVPIWKKEHYPDGT